MMAGIWNTQGSRHVRRPTNTQSQEEEEPEDFWLGSIITEIEVAGAVKQLHSGNARGSMNSSKIWMLLGCPV